MPLQIVFHLELARPSTITTVWSPRYNRFQVIAIFDNGRLVEELAKHAEEAGLSQAYGSNPQFPLIPEVFRHLRIEQRSHSNRTRPYGEIRMYMEKTDGHNTYAWVWKDNIVWIEARETSNSPRR
ncbi:MAG TPA: hypothetical protein VIM37_02370 [Candidatus Microsaccharimonas sp.]|jgi:hypothetical protein